MLKRTFFLVACLIMAVGVRAARAASTDPVDFRIRGIYLGMTEKQFQDAAGGVERRTSSEFEALNPEHLDLYALKKDKDMLVGIDKETHKVVFVMGSSLTREGSQLFVQGDDQFRAQLGMMPINHDDNWVFRLSKFNLAVQFEMDAARARPTIARIILEDPSIAVKGGWLDGVAPRPGPKNSGTIFW